MKNRSTAVATVIAFLALASNVLAQQSLNGIRLQDANNHVLNVSGPTTGFTANYNFRFPAAVPSTGSLLYSSDGVGQTSWLTAGSNGQVLTLSGGVPAWSNVSAGSVTSVGLVMPPFMTVSNSPVTSSGILTATLNTQSANLFFAGPSSGAGSIPSFRAIVAADIPVLNYVTSVSLTMPVALFTSPVSGSPVTSSGTLAPTLAVQSANQIFAGPSSGPDAPPAFRTLATADIPNSVITYSKIQNETNNTVLGNVSGSAAAPSEVTAAQLKTLLNLAGTNSGDLTLAGTGTYLSLSGQVLTQNPIDLSTANATGTLAAGRFPALTGDVTTVAGALATTIANNAVTYAKMQTATGVNKLVGSPSTGTALGEISIGTGLTMSGSTLSTVSTTGLFARKTANVTFTSNATLTADADLSVALAASATYEFSGVIAYNGATASSDLQLAMNIPAGATIRWSVDQAGTSFSASSVTGSGGTTTAISPFHTDGTPANSQSVFISGIVITGVTVGNLQVYEAQATSSAVNTTTVLLNSHIRAIRVQ